MPVSLQVLYPVGEGTHFDHDYYANKYRKYKAYLMEKERG